MSFKKANATRNVTNKKKLHNSKGCKMVRQDCHKKNPNQTNKQTKTQTHRNKKQTKKPPLNQTKTKKTNKAPNYLNLKDHF